MYFQDKLEIEFLKHIRKINVLVGRKNESGAPHPWTNLEEAVTIVY